MKEFIGKLSAYSERIAIIDKHNQFSFKQLVSEIEEFVFLVRTSVPEGAVVVLNAGLSFGSIACFFALALNKNIIVPVTGTNQDETDSRAGISAATHLIRFRDNLPDIELFDNSQPGNSLILELQNRNHPGLVLFSSGITGTPKAMVHDLSALMQPFLNKKLKSINFMAMLLFDHIGGLNTLLSSLFSGATLTIPANRDPFTICADIEEFHVGVLPASPTMLNLILLSGANLKYDMSSIRVISYGTEPMPEGLLKKLNAAFPRVRFLQTFGTSETGISQISSKSSGSVRLKFDDPDTEFRIVDNELWIRSKTQIMGYLNAPMDQFTVDGWFKTGDLVEQDREGYLVFTGRINEVINVGGLKVLPQEVESVLMESPYVANCLVFGEKNPITGYIVVSQIQLIEGVEKGGVLDEIRAFLRQRLERYKIPVKIRFVDEIRHNDRFKKIRNL